MMQSDSTTPAPAVYRHTSRWTHATHVTAELPADDGSYTHWWATFRGVAIRQPDAGGRAWRDHPPTPCYADEEIYVTRIPYVQGGTRVLADITWSALWGGFLAPVPAAWHHNADTETSVHISLSAPVPDCADVDDPHLLHHWTRGSVDPRHAWLWDAPPTATDDGSGTPAGTPAAPALWCGELGEDEIRTLRDELSAELARRKSGVQPEPVAAWMGELTVKELEEMYSDLKNEIVKRGLNNGSKGQGI